MLDSAEQLLEKIRLGEDSFVECKEVVFAGSKIKGPGRDELADELAAFANARGGVLVLGVDDKTREVVGIPAGRLDDVERYAVEIVRDSIKPPLYPVIERMELPGTDGRVFDVIIEQRYVFTNQAVLSSGTLEHLSNDTTNPCDLP